MENTKKLGANAPVSIVDGFPVRNDGTLVYDRDKKRYALDMPHQRQVGTSLITCILHANFGSIVDDRTKKSGKSFVKDKRFTKENPGVADFDNTSQIAKFFKILLQFGSLQKCDVNYNSHRGGNIKPESKKTRLIFAYFLEHEKVPGMRVKQDVYIKFSFTSTRSGIRLHLDSLHYGTIHRI